MNYSREQHYVVDAFVNSFLEKKDREFVLYGLGGNTEAILELAVGFNIVGLMDAKSTGQIFFGLPVLSKEEVGAIENPIIVIVARQSVVDIIYNRIKDLGKDGIEIYDVFGNTISNSIYNPDDDNPYWEMTYDDLIKAIDKAEVISFDVFDTLIMRRTLFPSDVFEIVESKSGFINFAVLRKEAEKRAGYAAALDEIYDAFQEIMGISAKEAEVLKETEISIDLSLILPRKKIIDAYNYAKSSGKTIYIISDMYYGKDIIARILRENSITGYKDILISSENKKTKEDGSLFSLYNDLTDNDNKLHIGDNINADIKMASQVGIKTFFILSAYEMLLVSPLKALLVDASGIDKRCVLGLIISNLYEDPFVLNDTKGQVLVNFAESMGYCFFGPILAWLGIWMDEKTKDSSLETILFPSRDGFLMKSIYEIISSKPKKSVYFRTSRRLASVAGINSRRDIEIIAKRKYQGDVRGFLMDRFGIEVEEEELIHADNEDLVHTAAVFENRIFEQANKERKRYKEYIENIGIDLEKKHFVFDFVSGGTVQFFLSHIFNNKLKGLCLATMNLPNEMYDENPCDIQTAMGNITSYDSKYHIGKYYLFLESVLMDDMGTAIGIDDKGEVVFSKDYRNLHTLHELQRGILKFVTDLNDYFFKEGVRMDSEDFGYVDEIFGTVFKPGVIITDKIKDAFKNDDIYDGVREYYLKV